MSGLNFEPSSRCCPLAYAKKEPQPRFHGPYCILVMFHACGSSCLPEPLPLYAEDALDLVSCEIFPIACVVYPDLLKSSGSVCAPICSFCFRKLNVLLFSDFLFLGSDACEHRVA